MSERREKRWRAAARAVRRRATLATTALALSLASGCVKNPVTGSRELVLLSAEDERRIGAEAAAEVEAGVGLVQDGALLAYVRQLGAQLAGLSPRKDVSHQFDIIDLPEPNAFALPDGHIYVSRGLLALSNEEDELATILGHEIGHVAARHAAQRYSRAAPVGLLTGITSTVVGVVSSRAGRAVAGFGGGINALVLAPYGREQEHEADRVGQDLAARGGWDPSALTSALTSLGRLQDGLEGGPRETSFLDSHPSTPERVANTRQHAASLQAVPSGRHLAREAFLAKLDGLLVGKNPEYGVFVDNLLLHPGHGVAMLYPRGWATARSKAMAAAQSPEEDAVCIMGPGPDGRSAMETLSSLAREAEIEFSTGPLARTIGGRGAAQATLQGEDVHLTLVLVEHRGGLLQLVALSKASRTSAYESEVESWIASLRDLTSAQRQAIQVNRLHVVAAATGDTLRSVAVQHGSSSPPELLAILNGVQSPGDPLPGGSVKLVVRTSYAAGEATPAGESD